MSASRPRIARTAKGKKPQYFSDPAIDKLLSIVMSLAGELSVTRERLNTLERLLEKEGVLPRSGVDNFQPDRQEARERSEERAAYLERVLRTVQMELEEATGKDMPRSEQDIIKHLS